MSADDGMNLLDEFSVLRETWRGMVAGLIEDGFTPEQAHQIITHLISGASAATTDDTEEGTQ